MALDDGVLVVALGPGRRRPVWAEARRARGGQPARRGAAAQGPRAARDDTRRHRWHQREVVGVLAANLLFRDAAQPENQLLLTFQTFWTAQLLALAL